MSKHVSFGRHGEEIEVIVRNSAFVKTFQRKVDINNKKELGRLLFDLKNKGVDLIGIIKEKVVNGVDTDWFS